MNVLETIGSTFSNNESNAMMNAANKLRNAHLCCVCLLDKFPAKILHSLDGFQTRVPAYHITANNEQRVCTPNNYSFNKCKFHSESRNVRAFNVVIARRAQLHMNLA